MLHMTKPELVIYTLFFDQIPMSLSMKNEKYIKALPD